MVGEPVECEVEAAVPQVFTDGGELFDRGAQAGWRILFGVAACKTGYLGRLLAAS